MKLAFVHQLPLEIYPPATNALAIFARQNNWEVRAWSIANRKGLPAYAMEDVVVRRPGYPGPRCGSVKRLAGFLQWHFTVARELARWQPDAILSIEPHSALAVWMYYRLFGGTARLLIHHHEYYAPADFLGAGSRTSRICHHFEKNDLFKRAEWVSQTNETRLRMMQADCAAVTAAKARVWPNYPPREWVARGQGVDHARQSKRETATLRLVCVGSLSFEDTFIREVCQWVAARPDQVSLHLCGHNVRPDVWEWIESLKAPHISTQPAGCDYDALPDLLTQFDVALVLYKGNTLNFVHNVPNKAIEALACGLEVWYPPEMEGMIRFHRKFPGLPLRVVDFRRMEDFLPMPLERFDIDPTAFSAEQAGEPLLQALHGIIHA
jgi:hypothetical protein